MLQLNKSILETVIPSGAKAHADFAAFAARDPEGTPVVPFQNIDLIRDSLKNRNLPANSVGQPDNSS